jgi:alkanesulfonate monooxygenase SsuD/methylene tetrahydromethanopterin reductase-like flavin-dependent oxidoreductase (luciferase family)
MQIGYFTERPYRGVDERDVLRNQAFFALPNDRFDHVQAADDYNYWLDEYSAAEELGFDVLALNEHHGNPICMGSVQNIEAAILARITKRARIALIGNPLPVNKHPLRLAEELATIDLISRGRLISGWVRGAGSEQFFNNANPAYNRELLNEAHEFILQAWTRPGPWRYEGKHFHYRHVNPWVLPYQKPHPPIWMPGVLSPETVLWAADRGYPYIGLGTAIAPTCELWDIYADRAAANGLQAGPENFGYVVPAFVAETEERAQELGRGFVFGGGQNAFSRPEHTLPPGYNSKAATRRLAEGGSNATTWTGLAAARRANLLGDDRPADPAEQDLEAVRRKLYRALDRAQDAHTVLVGTPEQVSAKIKRVMSITRPGVVIFLHIQGPVANEDRMRSLRLLAEHVVPDMRDHARRIGLVDQFERQPGSVKLLEGTTRDAVVDRDELRELAAL